MPPLSLMLFMTLYTVMGDDHTDITTTDTVGGMVDITIMGTKTRNLQGQPLSLKEEHGSSYAECTIRMGIWEDLERQELFASEVQIACSTQWRDCYVDEIL